MARRSPKKAPTPPAPAPTGRLWLTAGLVVLVLAAAATVGWWWLRGSAFVLPRDPNQNVLLVTIDTLRYDALSCDGGRATTPNLDRLAADGARFTFAHASAPLTLPEHTTILTGLYPYEHGVRDNAGYRLTSTIPTMATRLKALGFATGGFIGAFVLERRYGLARGFDEYDDRVGEVGPSHSVDETSRPADRVVSAAVDWIGLQQGKWFTWVHVYDPHAPYKPPASWLARYPDEPYLGAVSWTDQALGALFDRVRALDRPTLVIVTADHGEALGDHGEMTHGVFADEATLHVPLIVASIPAAGTAGRAPRGVTIDTAVRHIDLVPTVLDAIGAPPAGTLPGSSLRDLIAHGSGPDRPEYFEAMMTNLGRGWAPLRGVLVGRDKYIDLPIPELYNLAADPAEGHNLVSSDQARVQVLANVLRGYDTAPVNRPSEEPAAVRERLQSLGYVGTGPAPAREHYTEADDPKRLIDSDRKMHDAVTAFEDGRTSDAVALLTAVLHDRPDNAEAALDLAVAYWQDGDRDAAIRTLDTAMKNGATQPDVRNKLGLCLALNGQGARAIAVLQGHTTGDVDGLNALGLAYEQTGRLADARQAFRQVLDVDPGSGLVYENLASVEIAAKNYPGAEAALEQALQLDPTLTGARTDLGTVLAAEGRQADAIAAWTEAAERDNEAYSALFNLTMALEQAGRHDEARLYAQRFVDTAPAASYGAQIEQVKRMIGR